jgi:hypothetical protein
MIRPPSRHRLRQARPGNTASTGIPAMAAMLDGRIVCAASGSQPRSTHHECGAAAGKPGPDEPR